MKILIGVATQPQTKRVKDKRREIQEEKTNTDTEGNNNSFRNPLKSAVRK